MNRIRLWYLKHIRRHLCWLFGHFHVWRPWAELDEYTYLSRESCMRCGKELDVSISHKGGHLGRMWREHNHRMERYV